MALHQCEAPRCDVVFEAKRTAHLYCSGRCRQRAMRAGKARASVTSIKPTDGPGRNERAVVMELERIDQLESSLGAQALTLAAHLDSARDTGSAKTAVSREIRTLMALAKMSGAAPAGSHTDEVRRKREERLAAARGA